MFQKLVSNLPYSPALVGQLGFYAKRLRQEQVTRRLGLLFTVLALVVQSFAIIQPPEAANAAGYRDCSQNAVINCGAVSMSEFNQKYKQNATGDLVSVYNHFGITSAMIASGNAKVGEAQKNGNVVVGGRVVATGVHSLGRQNITGTRTPTVIAGKTYYSSPSQQIFASNSITVFAFFGANGQFIAAIMLSCGNPISAVPVPVEKPKPTPATACSALNLAVVDRTHFTLAAQSTASNGATISAYNFTVKDSKGQVSFQSTVASKATSAKTATFALATPGAYSATVIVLTSLGNKTGPSCAKVLTVVPPAMCSLKPDVVATSPECKPCIGDSGIWYKDVRCIPDVTHHKKAVNLTQNSADATKVIAQAGDRILYTLTVTNSGKAPATQLVSDKIDDVLEYSSLQDNGGGTFSSTAGTIDFGSPTVKPGETITRSFTVQVVNSIPSTPQGEANPASFDCKMANIFGDTTIIDVNCPPAKTVESVVKQLPSTGPGENMIFGTVILMVVTYFFVRSRQTTKEVRLIRHDFNMGTI